MPLQTIFEHPKNRYCGDQTCCWGPEGKTPPRQRTDAELRQKAHTRSMRSLNQSLNPIEIICDWMELQERIQEGGQLWKPSLWHLWFSDQTGRPLPVVLTLDALWKVEELLNDRQWVRYIELLGCGCRLLRVRRQIHATAQDKITALAAVLGENCGEKRSQAAGR